MAYSKQVIDHYENPRNVGKFNSDDQDVDMDAGNADPGSLSFSTGAANTKKVPQDFDIFSVASCSEESMTSPRYFFLLLTISIMIFLFSSFFWIPFNPRGERKTGH